jgi:peptidoglycan/LPS O-acetylase OafA/YrhL
MTREPKKIAVLACVGLLGSLIALDAVVEPGWTFFYASVCIELAAAFTMIFAARVQKKRENRMYFRAISAFFGLSVLVTFGLIIDVLSFSLYLSGSHVVAFGHVTFMLVFSDGIRNCIQDIRDHLSRNDNHAAGVRHD